LSVDPFLEPVLLADVDLEWADAFAFEAARIEAVLECASIEHIGSTAVPLRGKPIVDVQVVVDESRRAESVAALEALGFEWHGQGGVPGREYLTRRGGEEPDVNVHVFAAGDPVAEDNVALRDYLRVHRAVAREYVAVKEGALAAGHDDLLAYSDAKRAFVVALRDAARRWRDRVASG
jgi:GrpB-like predicted nucleotidyltransferase (UPF0157 family)